MMNISCEFEISTYKLAKIPFVLEGQQNSLLKVEKNTFGSHLIFQNETKNIPRQDFLVMNISCKFEKSTYNTLASRGVTRKSLHTAAAAYSCIIHSIHRMLSGGYNKYCISIKAVIGWSVLATGVDLGRFQVLSGTLDYHKRLEHIILLPTRLLFFSKT